MTSYRNDPRWMTARYAGTCKKCGATIKRGAEMYYYPSTKAVLCAGACGQAAAADFSACAFDEMVMGG